MKIVAVNGSPRNNWNTSKILQSALEGAKSAGAEISMVHLYEIDFQGCRSCFACKRIGSPSYARCGYKDGLAPVLKQVLEADALFLGSPIYFNDVTGAMRAFLERLWFPGLAYDKDNSVLYKKRILTKMFFTMNVPREGCHEELMRNLKGVTERIVGPVEMMEVIDTLQFDDYSKYVSGKFDPLEKKKRYETEFPKDCSRAYEIGKRSVHESL